MPAEFTRADGTVNIACTVVAGHRGPLVAGQVVWASGTRVHICMYASVHAFCVTEKSQTNTSVWECDLIVCMYH